VFPALPADHQKPTYFCGVEKVRVSELGVEGAEMYRDGEPPTVGVSDVVTAPPQTLVAPFATLQVPVKVPRRLEGRLPQVPDVDHELKVSIIAFALLGGP
jgi:hypothetical protein